MTKECYCYKVTVITANSGYNTVKTADGSYWKCDAGFLFVVTNDPETVPSIFGDNFMSMEKVGFGYYTAAVKK